MRDLTLGIDIGTTSVKSIVISQKGDIIFESSRSHDLISSKPGFAEEDPNIWWNSVKSILKELSEKGLSNRIAAIGVTGMVPTLILVDENLEAIRNSIQQNDARATVEITELKKIINEDQYFLETANTLNQQVVFPKILWLKKHEPENISKVKWIMGSYDFISTKLTGNPHVEINWALESGMWLVRERKWHEEILKVTGIKKQILPPVFEPIEVIGETTTEVEKETGFPSGIPVIAGSADHIASSLAVGLREEGDLLLKFGGAGDIMFVMESLKIDKRLFLDYHNIPYKYILNGCMAASGSLVKWYMNIVQENSYDELTNEALESDIGARGIVMLPYFLGEKTPIFNTKARGVIFGLGLHHNRGDIFRSILESVAFGFKHHIEVIKEMGFQIKQVFISDGGAKNPLWRQITADVIGMDIKYILNNPGSSLGVAFLAGVSVGIFKNWNEIDKFIAKSEIVIADQNNHIEYDKYYSIYRKLYEILKPLYEELYYIREVRL